MDGSGMRADLIRRVKGAVNDLRHEWVASGHPSESFTVEVAETATGVSVSVIMRVEAPLSTDRKDTPLSKKRL